MRADIPVVAEQNCLPLFASSGLRGKRTIFIPFSPGGIFTGDGLDGEYRKENFSELNKWKKFGASLKFTHEFHNTLGNDVIT